MAERRGIVLPFRVIPGAADVVTASGRDLRETRIGVILGMRASSAGTVGELPWDPPRGSRLDALRNAANSIAVDDFAAAYVDEALTLALPDERLVAIGVDVTRTTIEMAVSTQLTTDTSASPRALDVRKSIAR